MSGNIPSKKYKEIVIYILTEENKTFDLNRVPDELDSDLRYCVWDCSNIEYTDYYWLPLVFLESFSYPAVVLEIGPHTVQMPLDWNIMVTDEHMSDMEVKPLIEINDRGFHTVVFNPLKRMVPETYEVIITEVYADVKWYFPKLKNGNILVMPLHEGNDPACALFVKEGNRVPDPIDMALLFE